MQLIIYSPRKPELPTQLHNELNSLSMAVRQHVPLTVEEYYSAILSYRWNQTLGLLAPNGKEDLRALASNRDKLWPYGMLIVAPNFQEDTVNLCHQLRPRVLLPSDVDPGQLTAILIGLLKKAPTPVCGDENMLYA